MVVRWYFLPEVVGIWSCLWAVLIPVPVLDSPVGGRRGGMAELLEPGDGLVPHVQHVFGTGLLLRAPLRCCGWPVHGRAVGGQRPSRSTPAGAHAVSGI